ncbi:hypothetical protein ACFVAJ_19005 [Agromyces sp. NPDC057679]|uniref:hypothetical protein n=1 Tax=Agromyces sp. NPDC057679 TaxID=3346207 RepID=UPI00366D1CB4
MQDTAPVEPGAFPIEYQLVGSGVTVTADREPEQIGDARHAGGVVKVRSVDTGAIWVVSASRIVPPSMSGGLARR